MYLVISDKPNPPAGQPAASNITGSSLTLSWYGPSYDGGSCVTDYRVEMCKVAEMNWKTLTSNCKVYALRSAVPLNYKNIDDPIPDCSQF